MDFHLHRKGHPHLPVPELTVGTTTSKKERMDVELSKPLHGNLVKIAPMLQLSLLWYHI